MSATAAVECEDRSPLRKFPLRQGRRKSHRPHMASKNGMLVHPMPLDSGLPKSASYTYLPVAKETAYMSPRSVTVRGDTSSEDITLALDSADMTTPDSSGRTTPSDDMPVSGSVPNIIEHFSTELIMTPSEESASVKSASVEKRKSTASSGGSSKELESEIAPSPASQSSLASRLGRRISLLGSRSPSPSKSPTRLSNQRSESSGSLTGLKVRSILKKQHSTQPQIPQEHEAPQNHSAEKQPPEKKDITRRISILGKSMSSTKLTIGVSPAKSMLPKSFSSDRLNPVTERARAELSPLPSPRLLGSERTPSMGSLNPSRRRDELWSVFRQLDGDYVKFAAKSTSFKANVVRQSLLPFLCNFRDHPSNTTLRAEDLDRRTAILSKWWGGLLDALNGKHNQSLSGTDRPAILDALSGLMERPEWRPHPSPLCPLRRRQSGDSSTSGEKCSTLLASANSDFLTESVLHNVRNLFVQNLNTQLVFAVEKMCLRSASASLITFCGKAVAYAFYFCPGIADVLVRMWHTEPHVFKRILGEYGIGKFDSHHQIGEEVSLLFPPALHSLAFTSLTKTIRSLRQHVDLPPMSANLQFWGYWTDRWLGRESDLLYVFIRHYFILANDYLSASASRLERLCAPGMLVVQAQILSSLDSTIHRDFGMSYEGGGSVATTFDDLLGGPDAVVSTLPLLPANAARPMNENRLLMLVRGVLSEQQPESAAERHLFAISFMDMLHASVSGVSIFNHAACYTLCDLLEEVLDCLVKYEQHESCPGQITDPSFWLDVCRKMLTSQNTVTDIRLFSWLYTSWGVLCSSPERKRSICLGLLLDEDVFERAFTHWCPMVRAYFMRLVCWRVGRYDGDGSELETEILETFFLRLRRMWSYHLYEREQDRMPAAIATMPCNPAPGRRFLIVRTDTFYERTTSTPSLAFPGIIPPFSGSSTESGTSGLVARRAILSAEALPDQTMSIGSTDSDSGDSPNSESGLRGFLRGIMGSNRKRSPSRDARPRVSSMNPSIDSQEASQSSSPERVDGVQERQTSPMRASIQARNRYNFKFSLEFVNKAAQSNTHQHSVPRLLPPRLPVAAMRYLHEATPTMPMCMPSKPEGEQAARAVYVGRALAEWSVVVGECQAFFERRRMEGVPEDRAVETPTLCVELFRRS